LTLQAAGVFPAAARKEASKIEGVLEKISTIMGSFLRTLLREILLLDIHRGALA